MYDLINAYILNCIHDCISFHAIKLHFPCLRLQGHTAFGFLCNFSINRSMKGICFIVELPEIQACSIQWILSSCVWSRFARIYVKSLHILLRRLVGLQFFLNFCHFSFHGARKALTTSMSLGLSFSWYIRCMHYLIFHGRNRNYFWPT